MVSVRPLLLMIGIVILCPQWSSEDSSGDHAKPKLNFCGTFNTRTGKIMHVENITISGMIKRIPFYHKPDSPDVNPDSHRVLIDLQEVSEFRLPSKEPSIKTYNKRNYLEVTVVSDAGQAENTYLIEQGRKIKFDELQRGADTMQHEISFEALGVLKVGKHHARDDNTKNSDSPCKEAVPVKAGV